MKKIFVIASFLMIILLSRSAVLASDYTIIDLGSFSLLDINNSAQVLGNINGDAYVWESGSFTNLGDFRADSFNDSGQVVGFIGSNEYPDRDIEMVLWDNGNLNTIVDPIGSNISPSPSSWEQDWEYGNPSWHSTGITDSGTIFASVGQWTPFVLQLDYGSTIWEWSETTFDCLLYDVNNSNEIIGINIGSDDGYYFDYDNDDVVTYLEANEFWYYANSINDAGQVVGAGDYGAFLWDNGTVINLYDINLYNRISGATDINNFGDIVGWINPEGTIFDEQYHAAIWDNYNFKDLNDLINDDEWVLSNALAINDLGQIIGTGYYNGETRSFLLTSNPVPEPAGMALLVVGLAGLAWFSSKQKRM